MWDWTPFRMYLGKTYKINIRIYKEKIDKNEFQGTFDFLNIKVKVKKKS